MDRSKQNLQIRSIMASDSPSYDPAAAAEYQPQPGRSTPPPTTSYSNHPQPEDSTAIEPKEEKAEEKKDETDFSQPDANPDYKPENLKQDGGAKKSEFSDRRGEKRDEKKDGEEKDGKMNGDVLDAEWVRHDNAQREEKEENCAVNCIYYTMQCCECTIT